MFESETIITQLQMHRCKSKIIAVDKSMTANNSKPVLYVESKIVFDLSFVLACFILRERGMRYNPRHYRILRKPLNSLPLRGTI